MRMILDGCAIGALTAGSVISGCGTPAAAPTGVADSGLREAEASADSTGPVQACPPVGPIMTNPGETTVGGEVDVSVSVGSAAAGDVSYTWTATDGQFESSNVQTTRFACTAPGMVTIAVQVSGGTSPDGGPCIQLRSASVQCDPVPQDASVAFPCTGSPGNVCSPTELQFVTYDPTGTCYACLLRGGCIDGAADGPAGNECEDLMGDAVTGPAAGAWKPSLCSMTVDCILTTGCANPSVVNCYCGGGDNEACVLPGGAKGACLVAENAGLETSDPQTALGPSFTSKTLAAGMANAIFVCAAANGCGSCLGARTGGDASAQASTDAAEDSAPLDQ
jgi:hypothetical protein